MKKYRIRQYSPLWWMRTITCAALAVTFMGVMNTWELGLLQIHQFNYLKTLTNPVERSIIDYKNFIQFKDCEGNEYF